MVMQGSELRALRKGLGLTLNGMGDALGLSGVFIGMMERGEKPIERRTELAALYLELTNGGKTDVVRMIDVPLDGEPKVIEVEAQKRPSRRKGRSYDAA